MSRTKYTVVIPSRNRQKYCVEAVQSILLAERADVQIIVCDNSDDRELLPRLLEDADVIGDVTLLKAEPTLLPMRDNWERAIAHVEGEWLSYIGDDDGFNRDGFDMLDWFTNNFNMKVFTWRPTYYKWPCFPEADRGVLNVHMDKIAVGVGDTKQILSNHANWVAPDKWPNAGPSVYHCCAHMSLVERSIATYGRYFLNFVVDYSSAISNCTLIDAFMQYSGPVTIMGACGNSNTAGLTGNGEAAKKIDEFFVENPGLRATYEEFEDSKLHVPVVVAGYSQIFDQLGIPFAITPEKFAKSFRNELARIRKPETFAAEKERLTRFMRRHGVVGVDLDNLTFHESQRPIGVRTDPLRLHLDTTAFGWTGVLDVARNINAIQPPFGAFRGAHERVLAQLRRNTPQVFRRENLPRHSLYDMRIGPLEDVNLDDLPLPPAPTLPSAPAEQPASP